MKSVFSKIAEDKTELAKHEVALGIADDVKSAYKKAIDARKQSFTEYSKVKSIISNALKAQQDFKKINEDAIVLFNKYEAAAKELGLPLPADIKSQKENIKDGLKGSFVQYIKALQSAKL